MCDLGRDEGPECLYECTVGVAWCGWVVGLVLGVLRLCVQALEKRQGYAF